MFKQSCNPILGQKQVDPTLACIGLLQSGCDLEGWTYGFDWPFLKWPPKPGSGTCTMSCFVRQRRWIRARKRVPPALLQLAGATAMSADVGQAVAQPSQPTSPEASHGGGLTIRYAPAQAEGLAGPAQPPPTSPACDQTQLFSITGGPGQGTEPSIASS